MTLTLILTYILVVLFSFLFTLDGISEENKKAMITVFIVGCIVYAFVVVLG